jgi:hypothetical protein
MDYTWGRHPGAAAATGVRPESRLVGMVFADPASVIAAQTGHQDGPKISSQKRKGRIAATPAGKFLRNEMQPRQERRYSIPIWKNTVFRLENTP